VPEGHTIHRLARDHVNAFGSRRLSVTSPQGRFAPGAARLDGAEMTGAQAHGKHLFLGFADHEARHAVDRRPADRWLHVHLGLYGSWTFGSGEPPEPRGAVRVRFATRPEDGDPGDPGDPTYPTGDGDTRPPRWADLRGPTACEVLTRDDVAAIRARLGPDPLRRDADHAAAGDRVRRSRVAVGALLMQQGVVAGVGNVYRAEALFRGRIDPWLPGRDLDPQRWDLLWADLVLLLRDGVRRGRIVTTHPADRSRRSGTVHREDAYYVYKRTGLPCRICGTPVLSEPMAARTLYRCPVCQAS